MCRVFVLAVFSVLTVIAAIPAFAQDEVRGRATVVSSDILEVSGKRYRLYGIVGPRHDQKCKAGALPWLCGTAAFNALREQVEGKLVTCVDKGLTEDKKPTALCKAEGRDLSYTQVRNGWANADPKSGTDYQIAESAARASKVGFWK